MKRCLADELVPSPADLPDRRTAPMVQDLSTKLQRIGCFLGITEAGERSKGRGARLGLAPRDQRGLAMGTRAQCGGIFGVGCGRRSAEPVCRGQSGLRASGAGYRPPGGGAAAVASRSSRG